MNGLVCPMCGQQVSSLKIERELDRGNAVGTAVSFIHGGIKMCYDPGLSDVAGQQFHEKAKDNGWPIVRRTIETEYFIKESDARCI